MEFKNLGVEYKVKVVPDTSGVSEIEKKLDGLKSTFLETIKMIESVDKAYREIIKSQAAVSVYNRKILSEERARSKTLLKIKDRYTQIDKLQGKTKAYVYNATGEAPVKVIEKARSDSDKIIADLQKKEMELENKLYLQQQKFIADKEQLEIKALRSMEEKTIASNERIAKSEMEMRNRLEQTKLKEKYKLEGLQETLMSKAIIQEMKAPIEGRKAQLQERKQDFSETQFEYKKIMDGKREVASREKAMITEMNKFQREIRTKFKYDTSKLAGAERKIQTGEMSPERRAAGLKVIQEYKDLREEMDKNEAEMMELKKSMYGLDKSTDKYKTSLEALNVATEKRESLLKSKGVKEADISGYMKTQKTSTDRMSNAMSGVMVGINSMLGAISQTKQFISGTAQGIASAELESQRAAILKREYGDAFNDIVKEFTTVTGASENKIYSNLSRFTSYLSTTGFEKEATVELSKKTLRMSQMLVGTGAVSSVEDGMEKMMNVLVGEQGALERADIQKSVKELTDGVEDPIEKTSLMMEAVYKYLKGTQIGDILKRSMFVTEKERFGNLGEFFFSEVYARIGDSLTSALKSINNFIRSLIGQDGFYRMMEGTNIIIKSFADLLTKYNGAVGVAMRWAVRALTVIGTLFAGKKTVDFIKALNPLNWFKSSKIVNIKAAIVKLVGGSGVPGMPGTPGGEPGRSKTRKAIDIAKKTGAYVAEFAAGVDMVAAGAVVAPFVVSGLLGAYHEEIRAAILEMGGASPEEAKKKSKEQSDFLKSEEYKERERDRRERNLSGTNPLIERRKKELESMRTLKQENKVTININGAENVEKIKEMFVDYWNEAMHNENLLGSV